MDIMLSPDIPVIGAGEAAQPWRNLLFIIVVNIVLTSLIVVLDRVYGVDSWNIVRDPNAIARQPAYYGFYSNIGSVLWVVAGSTALFAAGCLRHAEAKDPRLLLLFLGGLFCAMAGLDDIFMFHEQSYLIGIPEKLVMAAYALFLMAVAAAAYPVFRITNWIYFAAALFCLGSSALVDMADLTISGAVLLEETLKFAGIAFLAAYLVTLAASAVSAAVRRTYILRQ